MANGHINDGFIYGDEHVDSPTSNNESYEEDSDEGSRTQHWRSDKSGSVRAVHDEEGSIGADSRAGDFDDEIIAQDRTWDVFEETPWENVAHADRQFWSRINIISRIILCTFLFLFITVASSIANVCFFIIVSNINHTNLRNSPEEFIEVRWVWSAIIMTTAPYLFTFLSCITKLSIKRRKSLAIKPLLMALFLETVHSGALCVFVYLVAPANDPFVVLMLEQGCAFIPAALKVFRVKRNKDNPAFQVTYLNKMHLGAFILTLVYLILMGYKHMDINNHLIYASLTPISLALLSVHWWENFIPAKEFWNQERQGEIKKSYQSETIDGRQDKGSSAETGSFLFQIKYAIRERRTNIDTVCSLWKIVLNILIPIIFFIRNPDCISTFFYVNESASNCSIFKDNVELKRAVSGSYVYGYPTDLPFLIAAVGVMTSGITFKAAKVACKINAQRICFALPLLFSIPLTFIILVILNHYTLHGSMKCIIEKMLSDISLVKNIKEQWWPLIFVGVLLIGLTSGHAWTSYSVRVVSTAKLFSRPLYCGIFFAQSLLLNRTYRADDTEREESYKRAERRNTATVEADEHFEKKIEEQMRHSSIPRIYACATMWHETLLEMTQLLKSLFRMDSDQFTRACTWKRFDVKDKDFYLYEAHIFFDDAFDKLPPAMKSDDLPDIEPEYVVNSFVRQLIGAVDVAARSIYPAKVSIAHPTKIVTPYGGRLTYQLPGGNPLVVHLKNKHLIRHKKRWSQVMYMYYLLSYKLMLGTKKVKKQLADNTFLLVLDGDVDFYPNAVQLLVDRMKKSLQVGAACGRIHPTGSGVMAWYQKFEYAASHWLQKAAEHVFGCVLCSPGCFSLFRASALMEDNVIRCYTKVAETAGEAIQYDMGEDRWLCTLLLQQGKRVEYCAAADALTFCPESFGEFFQQRRRWTPSTMANILDLLSNWRGLVKKNNSIVFPFIAYQGFLFVSSLLTPGTIFLLILGAINTAYPTLSLYSALLLNLIPVIIFIILCFFASQKVQIAYATVLSVLYLLVMMVVLVGLLRQIRESGMCSITAIFFVGVGGIFVVSALCHPQEISNIIHGPLYFILIPAMSMILIFYVVANVNLVSWGTRDTKRTVDKQPLKGAFTQFLSNEKREQMDGNDNQMAFSCGNLFRCIFCPKQQQSDYGLGDVEDRSDGLRQTLEGRQEHTKQYLSQTSAFPNSAYNDKEGAVPWNSQALSANWSFSRFKNSQTTSLHPKNRISANPLYQDNEMDDRERTKYAHVPLKWFEYEELGNGILDTLPLDETQFWYQLIEKYLKPLPDDQERNQKMKEDLTTLRNKTALLFFLGNALFITIIFILESVSEYSPGLTIQLPCDQGHSGQRIEPISVTFTIVFGILLIIQFCGMLAHRFSTFIHIVASTSLQIRKTSSDEENYAMFTSSNFLDFTRDMMEFKRTSTGSLSGWYSSQGTTNSIMTKETDEDQSGRNIVKTIIKRQRSFGKSQKHARLQDVVDESLEPVVKAIQERVQTNDNINPNSRKLWKKLRGVEAVLSLANDPKHLRNVQERLDIIKGNVIKDMQQNVKNKRFRAAVRKVMRLLAQEKSSKQPNVNLTANMPESSHVNKINRVRSWLFTHADEGDVSHDSAHPTRMTRVAEVQHVNPKLIAASLAITEPVALSPSSKKHLKVSKLAKAEIELTQL